jgi:transcriptional regulator with XRE-family HTH domain
MKEITFGEVLRKAREIRGISRPRLAEEIAGSGISQKGMEGQLSRFESDSRAPSYRRVFEIADALSRLTNDTERQKDLLLSQLMKAAKKEPTEPEQIEYLDDKCAPALRNAGLESHQVRAILDHASVATKERIAKAAMEGEKISFVGLGALASELQDTASEYSNAALNADQADYVINAGRARILVNGDVSENQKRLLKDIARIIRTALDT